MVSDNSGPGGPRFQKAFYGLQVEERCMAHQGTDDGQVSSKVGRFVMWMYNSAGGKEGYSQPEDRRQCEALSRYVIRKAESLRLRKFSHLPTNFSVVQDWLLQGRVGQRKALIIDAINVDFLRIYAVSTVTVC